MFNLTQKLKKRPGLWPYLFEFFTVMLSVYVAFLVTEWREEHKTRKEVEIAMERLNKEIFRNYQTAIRMNEEVTDRFEKMQQIERIWSPERNFSSYIGIFKGYQIADFKDAAWKRISNGNLANLMPVEYVERIHNLYEWCDRLEKHNNVIYDILYSSKMTDPTQAKTTYFLTELYTWQQAVWTLLQERSYCQFISDYKEYFQEYLLNDSIINDRFMSQDTLNEEQLDQFLREKRLYLNGLRGWNNEKADSKLAKKQ